ncbi:MAG: hypothetical protein PWQ42_882 [Sulfurospirillum sp.]|jgi:threonine/homoserine/homoserine lactone efflux protein|nr:hypothetical protein [Sulfurospirillum sp.]DAB33580.1 MAG TPA: threonine transporter [Sulfurospirillum sp. UBA12182]
MNEYLFILPISLALLLGVMSPGPSFLVVANAAMSHSRKKALFISLGMGLGALVFAFLASSGLYILLKAMPALFLVFKICGGLYLCYLAYKIISHAKSPLKQEEKTLTCKEESAYRFFLIGLFTQLSNPKTAIVIGGIFAAFMPENASLFSYALLCFIAFVLDASWYSIVALTLSTKKAQKAYSRYQSYINYLSGGIMGLIGAKLAISA